MMAIRANYPKVYWEEYKEMGFALQARYSFVVFQALCYNCGVRMLHPELDRMKGDKHGKGNR